MPRKNTTAKKNHGKYRSKKRPKPSLFTLNFQSWVVVPIVAITIIMGFAWVSLTKASTVPPPPCNGVNMCAPIPAGIPELIQYWSEYYQLDGARMLRIAQCESKLNPQAQSRGGHYGVYQFLSTTYAANHKAAGAGPDYMDAGSNIRTAAYMFSINQAWQWQCKG